MKKKIRWVRKVVKPSWFGDSFHYWPEELMPLAYAMACVEVVSTGSERAGAIFQQIIESWGKPGVQAVYDEIINKVPYSDKESWKQMIKNPDLAFGQDIDKPPWKNLMNLINEPGFVDKFIKGKAKIAWNSKEEEENYTEVAELFELMFKFMMVGFNREVEQAKGEHSIYPSTDNIWLLFAIIQRTIFEYHNITIERLRKIYKVRKIKDKTVDFEDVLSKQLTSRLHRQIIRNAKKANRKLRQDKKIRKAAWKWYQARVICDNLEQFCVKQQLIGQNDTSANLLKEIYPCDIATGYIRMDTGK